MRKVQACLWKSVKEVSLLVTQHSEKGDQPALEDLREDDFILGVEATLNKAIS